MLVLLNLISFTSSNSTIQFREILSYTGHNNISFANENNIIEWIDYKEYLLMQNNTLEKEKGNENNGSISDSIIII